MQISVCCSGNIRGFDPICLCLFPRQQGSPLLCPINNCHLVHYYADINFMLTSVYGNSLLCFVMGRVSITVYLLIDQNNLLYLLPFRHKFSLNLISHLTAPKITNFVELIFVISPLVVNFAECIFAVQLGFFVAKFAEFNFAI